MTFLRDKSTQTILQFLLIILLIHLMIKKYITTYGSIKFLSTDYSQLLRTEENNDIPDEESEAEEDSETESESEAGDLKNELVDYLDTQINMDDPNYGVKANKFYSDYRDVGQEDENLNVPSFVDLPKINQSASLSVAEEEDLNQDNVDEGVSGFDKTYSGYASL